MVFLRKKITLVMMVLICHPSPLCLGSVILAKLGPTLHYLYVPWWSMLCAVTFNFILQLCELCPTKGGLFKQTINGRYVYNPPPYSLPWPAEDPVLACKVGACGVHAVHPQCGVHGAWPAEWCDTRPAACLQVGEQVLSIV